MKKRKQHYVWKHYLEAWTSNGQLFCLRNKSIFLTNPINVAQKRDFYRLNELTEKDIAFVKMFFIKLSPLCLQAFHADLLNKFNLVFEQKKLYVASGRKDAEFEKQLDTNINNLEENLHCEVEGTATSYLEKIRNGDISFYDDEKSRTKFNYYLATQYFRTNHIKERMKAVFGHQKYAQFDLNIERIWNIVSHVLAKNFELSLSKKDSNIQLILLKNNTKIPLITSDQPLINIKADHSSFDAPTEFELYYPQTPTIALIFSENNKESYSGNLAENEVIELNNEMVATSQEQVYASEKSVLERYL